MTSEQYGLCVFAFTNSIRYLRIASIYSVQQIKSLNKYRTSEYRVKGVQENMECMLGNCANRRELCQYYVP